MKSLIQQEEIEVLGKMHTFLKTACLSSAGPQKGPRTLFSKFCVISRYHTAYFVFLRIAYIHRFSETIDTELCAECLKTQEDLVQIQSLPMISDIALDS